MKKRTKIVCGVLAAALLGLGGLAWWQRNTVEAVVQASKYTPEEIREKQAENKQKVQEMVDAMPAITVRDLTDEEKQALREGTMTQEELTEKLTGSVSAKEPEEPRPSVEKPSAEQPPNLQPPAQSAVTPPPAAEIQPPAEPAPVEPAQWEKDLAALIARVYVLQEQYTIALDDMEASAKAEYREMSSGEKKKKNLVKFAKRYVTEALDLEKECDAQMDQIVEQMEAILSENGGDTALVDTVIETYASEKSLKKAWYMAELEKRGWI